MRDTIRQYFSGLAAIGRDWPIPVSIIFFVFNIAFIKLFLGASMSYRDYFNVLVFPFLLLNTFNVVIRRIINGKF